jgi:cytochrome c oxidase subunit II
MTAGSSARRHRTVIATTVALATVLVMAGCAPAAVTAEGRDIETLYRIAMAIGTGIIGLVWLLAIIAIVRNRARGRTDEPSQVRGSNRLEAVWTIIPIVIVLGLFAGTVAVLARTEARAPQPAAIVDVEGFRWGWTVRYPDEGIEVTGIGTAGPEVVVPVGAPVRFQLRSADVIHSFYVPVFLFKRDVIPGRMNTFDVTVEEPGVYGGQCAEYCGIGHAFMPFTVRAVPQAEYDAWLAAARAASPAPPSPAASAAP